MFANQTISNQLSHPKKRKKKEKKTLIESMRQSRSEQNNWSKCSSRKTLSLDWDKRERERERERCRQWHENKNEHKNNTLQELWRWYFKRRNNKMSFVVYIVIGCWLQLRGRHLSLHSLTTNFNVLFILMLIFLRSFTHPLSPGVSIPSFVVLVVSLLLPILLF